MKKQFPLENGNNDNILVSNKIFFYWKSYKYNHHYTDDGYKIKSFNIIFQKQVYL